MRVPLLGLSLCLEDIYLADTLQSINIVSKYRRVHIVFIRDGSTVVVVYTTYTLMQSVSGDLTMLTLLDLSAAIDTVDHETLIQQGILLSTRTRHRAAGWFESYLDCRTQYVRCGSSTSTHVRVTCGVPRGSVLGPILFLLYTADLTRLIESTTFIHTGIRRRYTDLRLLS